MERNHKEDSMFHPTDPFRGKYLEAFGRQLLEEIEEAQIRRLRKQAKAGLPGLSERVREGLSSFFAGQSDEVQTRHRDEKIPITGFWNA